MKKYIANIITGCRIIMSICMLFFPAFSFWFIMIYLLCGFSDMVDGLIARKTKTVSVFGSKLDTVADFIFILAALIKIVAAIDIPKWLWIWIFIIAVIKIINIVSGYICEKKFVAEHTVLNKITGFILFILPLTFGMIDLRYSGAVVCVVATFAAIQEGHYIRSGRSFG
jgi:phosphatidylglycerophosphate synthase